jgi:regulation of enolase protein 1 (concanavalin A-like superfamily)
VYEHFIILNPGAESPRIYNVRLVDAGDQFLKANPDGAGGGVDNGRVEYSVFEHTTTAPDNYTNAIDVLTGSGWIVRNNLFRNIRAPQGQLAGPAVLFWRGSRDPLIEGNTFIDCHREAALGLEAVTPNDNTGGIVRNNFIYRRSSISGDASISIADSPSTQVLHNTILVNGTYPAPIEYRFANTAGVVIRNNLLDGAIAARDSATGTVSGNYTSATASMFVNPAAGDLHLRSTATAAIDRVAAVANAAADWDGDVRPQGTAADYGADEFRSATPPPNQPPAVTLTGPSNGATFTAPATITLSATASDADGSVAAVDFYWGSTVVGTDSTSPYSVSWINVAAGSYSVRAVARDNVGASTTSGSAAITVNGPPPAGLPAPWLATDVGSPAVSGSAIYSSGTFTVGAAGADIWGTADQFRFVYRTLSGDGEIIARVASLQNTDPWAKAGVMIRETLTPGSRNAFVGVTPASGLTYQRRATTGGTSTSTTGIAGVAPYWVRLVRTGSTFSAYRSTTGTSWTLIGSDTIAMAATVQVGLATTSHNAQVRTTATFTGTAVTAGPTNVAPSVSLTSPSAGATFTASAPIAIAASATDTDGTIASVTFYAGSALIGSDTTAAYGLTWSTATAGTYTLTAVAVDNGGASRTSAGVSITVRASSALARQLTFTASTNHASNVTSYTMNIFAAGANPSTATPVRTQNLGKPTPVNGNITVDIAALVQALSPGSYFATVTAIGAGGSARSAPSNTFTR